MWRLVNTLCLSFTALPNIKRKLLLFQNIEIFGYETNFRSHFLRKGVRKDTKIPFKSNSWGILLI
jgi:hypothetical protein